MNRLTVLATTIRNDGVNNVVRVFYSLRKTLASEPELLDIELNKTLRDPFAVAETVAIRYLLPRLIAKGGWGSTGRGTVLTVSKESIAHLVTQERKNRELMEYGYPLLSRYIQANVQLSSNGAWLPSPAERLSMQVIRVNADDYRGVDTVETLIGHVVISRHAIERYGVYAGTKDSGAAWKSLVRRLNHPDIRQIQLPEKVVAHKLRKYGRVPEVWRHPTDEVNLLLTVFTDKQKTT
jgi:hypothetical protein